MFKGRTCLLTGGTGSWGHELTRKLLPFGPKEIRIFSRNEFAQVKMQQEFPAPAPLRFTIGDIRDYEAVREACAGVDYVFHLAALKHVPICEHQPSEAMKTNVLGTHNIIRASIREGVRKVVDVSTDKAVDPVNFYGMTKALGEKLMIHANELSPTTRFICIRGGNVLGTNGSVVPVFRQQIEQHGEICLTHPDMTRFFLTVKEAINLLLLASQAALGGETFVMKMRSCKIADLAQVMAHALAQKPVPVREVGIRPGEKLHEVLVSRYESPHTYEFNEDYYVILPTHGASHLSAAYQDCKPVTFTQYDSSGGSLTHGEIRSLLQAGGFLP